MSSLSGQSETWPALPQCCEIMKTVSVFFAYSVRAVTLAALSMAAASAQTPKHVLVVTATQGFRHSSIPTAEKVLTHLGETSKAFTVDFVRGGKDGKDDADVKEKMTPEGLKKYDA